MDESAAAGPSYQAGLSTLDWYQGGEYVITDQLGMPVHPEWYSDEFVRLLKRARLPPITLHDSRHTTLTLHGARGSAHLHREQVCGPLRLGLHPEDLRARHRGSAALARIHKIA
jgi:hypothetical protein